MVRISMTKDEIIGCLALSFARRRWGSTAYMGGESGPTPQDHLEARRFVEHLEYIGWLKEPENNEEGIEHRKI